MSVSPCYDTGYNKLRSLFTGAHDPQTASNTQEMDKVSFHVYILKRLFYSISTDANIHYFVLDRKKYSYTFAGMIKDLVTSILTREAEAVQNIPITDGYEEAVRLIVKHVHELGGTLITTGMGKAGQIAMNMATTFSSTGTPAFFLHPSEAQHGDLGIVRKNDVVLLISNSGKTRELIELIGLARGLVGDIPFIVITSNPKSQLAKEAAVCLETGSPKEVCILGLTPTTSTTIMTVIGDLLVVSVMNEIGFSSADYAKRHHGGYLGSKSRQLSRKGE